MMIALLGRRGLQWYDFIFFALAMPVVFPDRVFDWISERTGWFPGRIHHWLLMAAGLGGMALTMAWLLNYYPKLPWWYPTASLVGLLITRMAIKFVCWMFGYEEDDLG
jgi:hypothetical protein